MLAGQRAWARMNALQIVNAVTVLGRTLQPDEAWPPPLQDLVRRCLSPDPAARPTAKQLLGELQALLDRASQAARTLAAAAGVDAPAEG
jgi:serine/threonine protein kinase